VVKANALNAELLDCRLLLDGAADGAWNMAVDEVLLEATASTGRAALRFYGWREPTLSLGYFQSHTERAAHPASRNLAVVRRSSGGGAIVHDRELTYSITIPRHHHLARDAESLYRKVHGALVQGLAAEGLIAELYEGPSSSLEGREPFLCFQRRAQGDVIVSQVKIAGSAQRRRRGAVLQHGSVLYDTSPGAPELVGLRQLTGRDWSAERLRQRLLAAWESRLELRLHGDSIDSEERRSAEALVESRFGDPGWTRTRGREFSNY